MTLDISAVICTLNSEEGIEDVCLSLKKNNVAEIIIVDGGSTDKTLEIVNSYATKIVYDDGSGLGNARNTGIKVASSKYILNCGADNYMPVDSIKKMIFELEENDQIIGIGALTRISGKNWFSKVMNKYRSIRYTSGIRPVIGTPTIFLRSRLLESPYDPKRTWSDDTALCESWTKTYGKTFCLANVIVYEIEQTNIKRIFYRWYNYGKSDYEHYVDNRYAWSFVRKLKSFLHPLYIDFVFPLFKSSLKDKFLIFPFLIVITSIRYYGWIKQLIKYRQNESRA